MKRFERIVAHTFKIPEAQVRDSFTAKDVAEWDSLNYLFLVAALEKEFGLSFSMEEVIQAKSLGDLRKLIVAKRKPHAEHS